MNCIADIDVSSCTGCGACLNICPSNAIFFDEHKYGFAVPVVDIGKCTNCGKCKKVCPTLNIKFNPKSKKCYALKGENSLRVMVSSGGGVEILAQKIISENGYVCGAAFDDFWNVRHIVVDNQDDLKKIYKSKYVQSSTQGVYREIENLLEQEKTVLFTGTPCQVAGLYGYLRKDYSNLITADILCHGVPGNKLWQKYLNESYDRNEIKCIDFRNKEKFGWVCNSLTVTLKNGETVIDETYTTPFHRNLSTRYSCNNCMFKKYERVADITFGDFWGISKLDETLNDNKGISFITVNSDKGEKYLSAIKDKSILFREFEYANIQNSLYKDSPHKHKKYFLADIVKNCNSFKECAQRWLKDTYDVALLGYYSGWNYGTSMTYYSLYKVIKKLGYSCVMIQNPKNALWKPHPIIMFKENPYESDELSQSFNNIDEMRRLNAIADKFIVGSDQVFMKYMYEPIGAYTTLDFIEDSKEKYAFSASFGYKNFVGDNKLRSRMGYFLKKFDKITTREYDGVNILKENFDIDGTCTLDPVFLLDDFEYKKLAEKGKVETSSDYLLAYILDQSKEKTEIIMEIAKRKNLSVKFVYDPIQDIMNNKLDIHTEDWLKYYSDAKYVITDSYHGTCMALKFKKQFWFFRNEYRGASRFDTLISDFDIGDRIISTDDNIEENLKIDIDYNVLNEKMRKRVEKSLDILKTMLSCRKNKTISDYDLIIEKEISLINQINSPLKGKQIDAELNRIKEYLKYSQKEKFYRFKYIGYRFIQNFCFGKARQNIGLKKCKYKEIVELIDTF